MNVIDGLVLLWLFAHLLLGAHAGLFSQMSRLVALVAGATAAHFFPVELSKLTTLHFGWNFPYQETLCSVALFLIGYGAVRLFLLPFNSLIAKKESFLYRPNRWLGGTLGLASAALIAVVLLSATHWVDKRMSGSLSNLLPIQDSAAMAVAKEADLFTRVKSHERHILRWISDPTRSFTNLSPETDITSLMTNVRAYLGSEIMGWIDAEDWSRVLSHPRTLFVLESRELRTADFQKALLRP